MPAEPCPRCFRPVATAADEALWVGVQHGAPLPEGWEDEDATHLCWRAISPESVCVDNEDVNALRREWDDARARADALQARLDVLLGPVEGDEEPVNPEEVIALAQVLARQEAEGVEMYSTTALQAERAVPLAREVVRLRADIKALRQQVAAALADLPENVKRVESDLRAEVDILRRERHAERLRVQERDEEIGELRLTLAAEQGKFECLPFSSPPRLRAAVNAERILRGLSWRELAAQIGVSSSGFTRWNAGHDLSVPAYLKVCDWLRAAMLDANKATETP